MISPYDEWFPEEEVPEVLTELGSIGILTLSKYHLKSTFDTYMQNSQ